MVHRESPSGFVFAGLAGAKTFNMRLNFAVEQTYGPLPIVLAYGLSGVLSAVFRGLYLEIPKKSDR